MTASVIDLDAAREELERPPRLAASPPSQRSPVQAEAIKEARANDDLWCPYGIASFTESYRLDLRAEADRIALGHEPPLGIRGLAARWVDPRQLGDAVPRDLILTAYELSALLGWVRRAMERAQAEAAPESFTRSDLAADIAMSRYGWSCRYNLVYRHFQAGKWEGAPDVVCVPIGYTGIGGSGTPIDAIELGMPFRDGAHATHDAKQLGLPLYVRFGDRSRLVETD